jgi:nucleotide-binding universal stress UspA family protein
MDYRTILTVLDGGKADVGCLRAAYTYAKPFNGHIEALYVRLDPRAYIDFTGDAMTGDAYAQLLDSLEQEVAEGAKKARTAFDEWMLEAGVIATDKPKADGQVSASWREQTGVTDRIVSREGRLADLIVLPTAIDSDDPRRPRTIERTIFDTGRPLLVVPANYTPSEPKHVGVLWNASAQASRAVEAAMPLLVRAKTVEVLWADEDLEDDPVQTGLPRYLAWHGVKSKAVRCEPGEELIGEQLLDEAVKRGADLVVMGAFTHSRLREFILGGVTQHMLENATVPVLMAH